MPPHVTLSPHQVHLLLSLLVSVSVFANTRDDRHDATVCSNMVFSTPESRPDCGNATDATAYCPVECLSEDKTWCGQGCASLVSFAESLHPGQAWCESLGGFELARVALLDDADPAAGLAYTFAGGESPGTEPSHRSRPRSIADGRKPTATENANRDDPARS